MTDRPTASSTSADRAPAPDPIPRADELSASYLDYYAVPLGHGRAQLRVDVVIDGQLVESHDSGSPAPAATIAEHVERRYLGGAR